MSFQTEPLFGDPTPRPRQPSAKDTVARLRAIIRDAGGASRIDEVPPGTLVRWHKKLGDDLDAILASVPWPKVEHPVSYLSAAVHRREREKQVEQEAPKYEVYKGDSGPVVAIRHADDITRIGEVLRGVEAVEFINRHANGDGSDHPVSDPSW